MWLTIIIVMWAVCITGLFAPQIVEWRNKRRFRIAPKVAEHFCTFNCDCNSKIIDDDFPHYSNMVREAKRHTELRYTDTAMDGYEMYKPPKQSYEARVEDEYTTHPNADQKGSPRNNYVKPNNYDRPENPPTPQKWTVKKNPDAIAAAIADDFDWSSLSLWNAPDTIGRVRHHKPSPQEWIAVLGDRRRGFDSQQEAMDFAVAENNRAWATYYKLLTGLDV